LKLSKILLNLIQVQKITKYLINILGTNQ